MYTAEDWKRYFKSVAVAIDKEKDILSELDRKIGDGDHGVTMSIGWQAVKEKLEGELKDAQDCGKICVAVGRIFLNAVGSTVGPLYATGFLRGANVLQQKSMLSGEDLVQFWTAFVDGIKARGQAEVGDKTMVDTFAPARDALRENFAQSGDLLRAFTEAVAAGEQGMRSTRELISKKGRSSRLGQRSVGNQDPGATSAYILLQTFLQSIRAVQNV